MQNQSIFLVTPKEGFKNITACIVLSLGISLSLPRIGLAQNGDSESERAADDQIADEVTQESGESSEADERVVVIGQRSRNSLVLEGAELTEEFYSQLNVVLDDEDYRIVCESEFRLGTRIPNRVCRTNFQRRLRNQEAVSVLKSIVPNERGELLITNWNGTYESTGSKAMAIGDEFLEAVRDAINSDATLNRQFHRLRTLQDAIDNYETPRQRRRRLRNESRRLEEENQ